MFDLFIISDQSQAGIIIQEFNRLKPDVRYQGHADCVVIRGYIIVYGHNLETALARLVIKLGKEKI